MAEIKRSFAVIFGINKYYNNIPELKTAVNDASKLAHILESKYQYQVLLLLDTIATHHKLSELLTAFEKQELPLGDRTTIQLHENDRLLFYFAGHGIALDALDSADGPTGFLVPQDARMDNEGSLLPMKRLHDALLKLPCRHLLLILDCCFAGAFRWAGQRNTIQRPKMYQERYERFISGCAQQVITSAADDEKATDSLYRFGQRVEHEGHSPFAELLFRALDGEADLSKDGIMTATEIYVYIHSELAKTTIKQTPGFCQLKRHDKGEYIFAIPNFDPDKLAHAPTLNETTNPYRGLESFEEEHSKLFFGRKALIKQLQNFVTTHPLTVILGPSGSGKSSIVKAGLIPQLKQIANVETLHGTFLQWRILAPVRPGESPFTALNNTLEKENLPVIDPKAPQHGINALLSRISPWSQLNPNAKLLLVIDQFEELITLCHNETERENFLNGLAKAIKEFSEQLRIVVTLRSDFEPQFLNTPLEPYWTTARFIAPSMTREELREAIVEPATTRVMYFEPPSLVDKILDEVIQMPGTLPILSFTLSELYLKYIRIAKAGKRNNRAITQEDYKQLGGVTNSLTQRAECEYDELVKLDSAYAQIIKCIMLRMVAVGSGEFARRRVLSTELTFREPENTQVNQVIERFAAVRLLVKGRDTEGQLYVEPAHDALVRGWKRLMDWEKQELGSVLLQRELTPTANKWSTQKQNKNAYGLLWDNDPRLPLLMQLSESNKSWLNAVELEFLERSIQRRRNNRYRIIGYVTSVILGLLGLSLFAFMRTTSCNALVF